MYANKNDISWRLSFFLFFLSFDYCNSVDVQFSKKFTKHKWTAYHDDNIDAKKLSRKDDPDGHYHAICMIVKSAWKLVKWNYYSSLHRKMKWFRDKEKKQWCKFYFVSLNLIRNVFWLDSLASNWSIWIHERIGERERNVKGEEMSWVSNLLSSSCEKKKMRKR